MLIGLTGYARSGKDAAFATLAEFGFEKYAFADALRQMAVAVDPIISLEGAPLEVQWVFVDQQAHTHHPRYSEILARVGYETAKSIPDFRLYLQRLGTEGARGVFGDNVWVDALHRVLDARTNPRAAITDVRFHNEARYVHEHNGALWRIVRPGFGGSDPHPSEKHIAELPADIEIVATTLDELRAGVIAALTTEVLSA